MSGYLKHICLLTAAVVMAAFAGCQKDDDAVDPAVGTTGVGFSYDLGPFDPVQEQTRSILSGSDIEDRITGITVTVYKAGRNIASRHYTQGFTSMTFDLEEGEVYDIYALVNMDDQTSFMPASKTSTDLSSLVYEVPSYSYVNQHGLPMAGKIEGFTAGTDSPVIPLRRLFAKVTADLSMNFDGARINGVKVYNLNGALCPFGSSKAAASSSIMTDVESHSGNGGSYVFYVPENMQGVIGSATAPHYKNPDSDSAISAKKSVLTYMEVDVDMSASSDYSGSVTYRSYLGNNNTKNFDIRGNCRYVWKVSYSEDNLQYDDWKVDTGDMTDDRILSFITDPVYAEAGESVSFSDVISTSLGWDAIAHAFTNDSKGILDSHDSQMLTVKGSAADGATLVWDIAPKSNPASVGDQAVLQVVKRYIDIKDASYPVDPGKSVAAEVDYGDSGRGRIKGKGGTLWSHTLTSGLSSSYSSADDMITISVPSTFKPGKYSLSVKTSDGLFADAADVVVNDTRYIDLLPTGSPAGTVSNEGACLDVSTPVGTFTGTQNWVIPFNYGDVTGQNKVYGVEVSDHAATFGIHYDNTWLSQVSLEKGKLTMKPKSGIPMGAYPVVISYKDNGFSPVTAYLNITGKLVSGISLSPSPMVVWIGEPKSFTATVTPSDATVQTLAWSMASGSEYASVDADGKVTGIKPGSASVVARATDGSGVASSAVAVEVRQHVTSVTLNKTATTILVGGTETLAATVKPDNAYDRTVTWTTSDATIASVDANGKIVGKKAGTCVVKATSNDLSSIYGECTVTVKDDVSNRIVLSPASFDLDVKATRKITAKYYTTTNGVEDGGVDVTASAAWTTSNSSLATVSGGTVTGKAAGSVTITASYGGASATASVSVKDVISHRMVITPANGNVNVGGTLQMEARYYTTVNGVEDSGVVVSTNSTAWTSSNTSRATVSTSGLVTGKAAGEVTISATHAGTTGSTSVFVGDVITYSLVVSPSSATVNVGDSKQFTATYYKITNGVKDGGSDVTSQATWTSSNSSVAVVNSGRVTVGASGGATITATYNGVKGTATLTGKDVITYSLEISPSSPYVSVGSTTSVTAKLYTITNGVKNGGQDVTSSAQWTSSNTGVATVAGGTVTGVSSGTATITAKYNGYTATATVSVGDVITYELTVSGGTSVDVNGTASLTATYYKVTNGVRGSGTDVTSSASWSTSNSSYATVSKGVVTGKAAGNVTITASYGSGAAAASDSHTMAVKNVYTNGLTVTPGSATVDVGETQSFKATFYSYTNGVATSQSDVTSSATWTSGTTSVATVNGSGVATGKAAGSSKIWASYNGYEDYGTLTVEEPVSYTYELVISPSSLTLGNGDSGSLTATYNTYANGSLTSSKDVTSNATWSKSGSGFTVSKGTVSCTAWNASGTVTATYNGYSDSVTIYGESEPVSYTYDLVVSPSSLTLDNGDTGSLTATFMTYINGVLYESRNVSASATWSSSNPSGVSVSGGTVTAKAYGASATITASYNGWSDSATVSVNAKPVEYTYELVVSASQTSFTGGGSTSAKATYNTYADGSLVSSQDVTSSASWSSSNTSVATVSAGSITVNDVNGSANIYASYNGESDYVTIDATKAYVPEYTYSLTVSPSSWTVTGIGLTKEFVATYHTYVDGSLMSSEDVSYDASWVSSDEDVVVAGGPELESAGAGSATVTVSYKGKSASVSVTVEDIEYSYALEVTPSSASGYVGDLKYFTATFKTYRDKSLVSSVNVTDECSWSSSNSSVCYHEDGGAHYLQSAGSATITATYYYNGETYSDNASVSANNKVTSKTITIYLGALSSSGTVSWSSSEALKCDVMITLMWSDDMDQSEDNIVLSEGSSSGTISAKSIPSSLVGKYPDESFIVYGSSCVVDGITYTHVL